MNPSDIARETIKLLAQRRLPPTPENYHQVYRQIAQQHGFSLPKGEADVLAQLIKDLPRQSAEQARSASSLEKALAEHRWDECSQQLRKLVAAEDLNSGNWAETLRDFLKQWEIRQVGLSSARKKEALERVLINFGNDPIALPQKIQALAKSWAEYSAASALAKNMDEEDSQQNADDLAASHSEENLQVLDTTEANAREIVVDTLLNVLLPRLHGFAELGEQAERLVEVARHAKTTNDWKSLQENIHQLIREAELQGVAEVRLQDDLLRLLKLLVDNIAELLVDDQWIRGQIAVVQTIISSELDHKLIANAEKSIKEVIYKQGTLKHSLNEAKHTFKQMVATFIDRLGQMAASTGEFHDKIDGYAEQIQKTDDIDELGSILGALLDDARAMQLDIVRSKEALEEERHLVEITEERVRQLEKELEEISEKVREDQLTGVLNRRGIDESLNREIARASRSKFPLAVALLDIDDFKKLNDTYGHQTGDQALKHLADVIKKTLRPTDIVGRFGGEEFLIMLPNTRIDEAITAITRAQRELTKHFFLHNNERLLITFSAGVAVYRADEPETELLMRADQAMYAAKKAGKNRVLGESEPS